MFVKNLQKKEIALRSFEGYEFEIPVGVSWIWNKAGEHLLTNVYRIENKGGKDKYGFDNGHGIPPLISATKEDWIKEGKKLVRVRRFQINAKLIPRAKLITIAKQRGVDDAKILEYISDPNIDAAEITEAINSLPVPDSICYPVNLDEENLLPENGNKLDTKDKDKAITPKRRGRPKKSIINNETK